MTHTHKHTQTDRDVPQSLSPAGASVSISWMRSTTWGEELSDTLIASLASLVSALLLTHVTHLGKDGSIHYNVSIVQKKKKKSVSEAVTSVNINTLASPYRPLLSLHVIVLIKFNPIPQHFNWLAIDIRGFGETLALVCLRFSYWSSYTEGWLRQFFFLTSVITAASNVRYQWICRWFLDWLISCTYLAFLCLKLLLRFIVKIVAYEFSLSWFITVIIIIINMGNINST